MKNGSTGKYERFDSGPQCFNLTFRGSSDFSILVLKTRAILKDKTARGDVRAEDMIGILSLCLFISTTIARDVSPIGEWPGVP